MLKRAWLAACAVALISLLVACDDNTTAQVGDLHVTYRVGSGTQNCEEAGISFVRVYVSISETEDLVDQIFPCDPEDQSVIFNDVEAGDYTVRVEGLDGDNNAIYQGENTDVTVEANQTNEPDPVRLSQILPSIELFFDFVETGNCDSFGVVELVVLLYRDGVTPVHDQAYDCATQLNESLVISDLSATSTYDLRVRGTNENGEYTHEYNQDGIEVQPGPPLVLEAAMEACSGLCADP